nr:hypothetical protein [Occallatibacter riparius]
MGCKSFRQQFIEETRTHSHAEAKDHRPRHSIQDGEAALAGKAGGKGIAGEGVRLFGFEGSASRDHQGRVADVGDFVHFRGWL